MFRVNFDFVIGKPKLICEMKVTNGNPLEFLLKKAFRLGLIDGVLTSDKEGKPSVFSSSKELTVSSLFFFGLNSFLKKAIQEYSFNKLCVVAPSCILDGLNKIQYYGIGCNWLKTAISLKIGIVCVGIPTKEAMAAEVMDVTGSRKEEKEVISYRINRKGLFALLNSGKTLALPIPVHHFYLPPACKYCLNLSAKGADISYLPDAIFIIRSERGLNVLNQVTKNYPDEVELRVLQEEDIYFAYQILKDKIMLNINEILEKVEYGISEPKWNNKRFHRFYKAWNSFSNNIEEEVF